jgi:hypothetical protein
VVTTVPSDVRRLGFEELRDLQDFLETLLDTSVPSMATYYDSAAKGFVHRLNARNGWSRASTATCVAYLEESGRWALAGDAVVLDGEKRALPWKGTEQALTDEIVAGETIPARDSPTGKDIKHAWQSAGLGVDNAFTVSFLLNALDHLRILGATLDKTQQRRVTEKAQSLLAKFGQDDDGGEPSGLRILPFPATAFLTYKAVKALDAAARLPGVSATMPNEVRARANSWAWRTLRASLVEIAAQQIDADPFELAYALMLVVRTRDIRDMRPADRGILRHALDVFFAQQTDRGTWPRSRPLFMYPKVGNAYCYDYELLTEMLGEPQLREMLLDKLPDLAKAARAVDQTKYPLENGYGWASGHHRQDPSAESWSTASVYHYLWSLQRLVAEAIRVEVFRYAGARYAPPADGGSDKPAIDVTSFADSQFKDAGGRPRSLVKTVNVQFLRPIAADRERTDRGLSMKPKTPCSAIVYGPPGTSKTTLAKLVAAALGWPHLLLDPSHLTRNGLDRLHEESNRIFGMLAATERVVVLLDEFDELVRERAGGSSEFISRFLTTSMLPKIQALAERRRLVWIIATNHIDIFDSAIRRPGRFDMIVPLLPPTAEEKLVRFPGAKSLADKGIVLSVVAKRQFAALTWGESEKLDADLAAANTLEEAERAISQAEETGTMHSDVNRAGDDDALPASQQVADPTVAPADRSWSAAMKAAQKLVHIP